MASMISFFAQARVAWSSFTPMMVCAISSSCASSKVETLVDAEEARGSPEHSGDPRLVTRATREAAG
jgi:hypothetical protein